MKENNNKVTRKNFLKTATAVAAAAALGTALKPNLRAFAKSSGSKNPEPGKWKSTT